MALNLKDRDLVMPGDLLGENARPGKNTYVRDRKVYAAVVGMVHREGSYISVVALNGSIYIPSADDQVIGIVEWVKPTSWSVDIGQPYRGILPYVPPRTRYREKVKLSDVLNVGDCVFVKVNDISRDAAFLSTEGMGSVKLEKGTLMEISPVKVPRILGKKQSMLDNLKKTGAEIIVGQNGRIWIYHKDKRIVDIVKKAIEKISAESHVPGLTDRIKMFIEKEMTNDEE